MWAQDKGVSLEPQRHWQCPVQVTVTCFPCQLWGLRGNCDCSPCFLTAPRNGRSCLPCTNVTLVSSPAQPQTWFRKSTMWTSWDHQAFSGATSLSSRGLKDEDYNAKRFAHKTRWPSTSVIVGRKKSGGGASSRPHCARGTSHFSTIQTEI